MMASKIVACLERSFTRGNSGIEIKGRDFYDLIWFMQKGIYPDEDRLINRNTDYRLEKVFSLLDKRVEKISKSDLLFDLEPLFNDKTFINEWCDNFHSFYAKFRKNYK